jgi:flagellar basal body rod protein FlgG
MKARLESLDILANNIANSGTTGFKSDLEFYSLYHEELPEIERHWTDFSQGTLVQTGNPLDLALAGPGFFALNSPSGSVYTRNGNFRISKSNQLETAEGYTLRNVRDPLRKPVQVDPAQAVEIDKDGVVKQGGQEVAQLEIAGIDTAPTALGKLGNSYFALLDRAQNPAAARDAQVHQGKLEHSNVPVSESAVRLITVLRQFEMLQKAVSVDTDMSKRTLEEVAKVA